MFRSHQACFAIRAAYVRSSVAAVLIAATVAPAIALEKANPSCGSRSKNPQAYDFCMQLTGQERSNPIAGTPIGPVLGGNVSAKPNANYNRCVDVMKSRQHMRAADAAAYCMQLTGF